LSMRAHRQHDHASNAFKIACCIKRLTCTRVDGLRIMSKRQSIKRVLVQAQESEKKFDWLHAIDSYERIRTDVLKQKDFLKTGEIQERIGFCFHQAAFQADNGEDFRERMHLAIEAYEKAHGFYEKLLNKDETARKFRCDAVAKYLDYWLASDSSEKRKLLDDCLESESKALASFRESGAMLEYARTYNELSFVFYCRVFLEWDRQILKSILEKGLEWGEQAIAELSDLGDSYEIARSYFTLGTCLSDAGFYLIAESEDIDRYRLKAVNYLRKAAELSEKVGDAVLLGLSHLWLGINAGGEEAVKHHEKTLEYGEQTRHNFLIANGLDYLAYDTYWKALATENPEKRRKLAKKAMRFYEKAHNHYRILSFISPRGGFIGPPSGQAEHYYQQALWETNSEKRSELLEKSEKIGMEALTLAEDSDMPMIIAQVLHVISKTLQAQAYTLRNPTEKRACLEKALKYRERTVEIFGRLSPFFYWNLGVMQNYLAGIQAELAELAPDLNGKRRLLEKAVLSKEECLKLCSKVIPYFERKGETALFAALQDYQDTYATLLLRLYDLTGKLGYLRKTIETLKEAIESARKLDIISLVAESYWKIAKAQDILGEHLQAAGNFERASESYLQAAEKVQLLRDFYQDHATYMKAWNEIEKARIHHAERHYGQAKDHYKKAADLHESTKRWTYLNPNYLAWARLEEAEDLSRGEIISEAIQLFKKAAKLFRESKNALQMAADRIENTDEKDLAERLIKASGIREEYCLGRIALEEAKILSRQGNHDASSEKFGIAAEIFQNLLDNIEQESRFTKATMIKDRHELMPIIYLCRAWQMMARAETEASPNLYLEASKLFEKAKESSVDESAKLLALGHSRFCKALDAGVRFEESRDTMLYLSATQHLESAANYYVRANFKIAAEYAIATQRLFDAYVYITNANKEANPGKKARYYIAAEKVLQISIGSYLKAKHSAKSEQVQRLLEKVREERELAVSLSEILVMPTITSSTTSFVTPSPSEETAVGLEKFEHANIQANIILPVTEIPLGEEFNLKIQIANVGKESILLDKVEGFLPPGFRLVAKPNYCSFEDMRLSMRGKRLDPLKTEEIELVLRALGKGISEIGPKILYVDNTGHQLVSKLKPVTIEVTKVALPDRVATGYEPLDNLLLGGIPEKYAVILTAPSCDESDLLIRRFLEAGIREGQITFHVTTKAFETENLTKEFQPNFYRFICNPQADAIMKSQPNVFKLKGVENLTDINIALTSALRKLSPTVKAPRRCCIQIVSDVLLQHKALQTRRWLTGLLTELKSKGFTILSVMDLDMHSLQEARAVLDLFEGEISIYGKTGQKGLGKFLAIKRMARQKYLEIEISLSNNKP